MKKLLRLVCAVAASWAAVAQAQTRAFNETFTGASTVNANPSSPLFSTSTAASYQQLAVKAFNPNPPVITSGNLRFGIAATSSGFNSLQALFTKYPVTLVNTGDYIELTVVFSTEGGILTPQAQSSLMFGLYNAGQVQPYPGGMNGTSATATAGFAQNWQGYVSRLFYTGGANVFTSRPAQSASGTNNQDVLYAYTGSTNVGTTSTSTLAALTANALYTEVFRITKATATTLTLKNSFYAGGDATGTPLYTRSVNSTSTLTSVFDAFAIGWRATGSVVSTMNLKSVLITTTGTTTIIPEILTQPLGLTKSVGDSTTFTVVADGGPGTALSYQWKKNGADIAGATASSYAIPSVSLGDSGDYTVVITDIAGATTSDVATLTVTTQDVAPTVVVQPVGGAIIAGDSFTFSATVNGTAPISYQWQRSTDGGASFVDLPGAAGSSYTVANATVADAALYRLVAANSVGAATSAAVALVVNQAPVITAQPVGGTLSPGGAITLSVAATGTPAPTYQWKKNGATIAGATGSSYTIAAATGADTANYTVVVTNAVGTVTSSPASVAVVSSSMAANAFTPAVGSTRNPDTRLTLTFNQTPSVGVSGFVRIYDAATNAVVDTIDLVAATALRDSLRPTNTLSTQLLPVQTKTIGGMTNFNYYPITVAGNTATIYPRNGVLNYGKTYYVRIDPGVFVNSVGESFAGISDSTTWRFSTKTSAPATGTASLVVAADGSADFDTVQGALDFIPANNVTPMAIHVKNGTYFEIVAFQAKHFVTILGEDPDQTVIVYPNNAVFNSLPGAFHRGTFYANGPHDFTIANLTIRNTTPQNGSQAEALVVTGTGVTTGHNIISRCKLYSYQDTLQINNQAYVSDSTIVGDVDFMWGNGPAFFENCDIRMLRSGAYFTQVRNGSGNHGYVFKGCRFTAPAGITGTYLGRIDPTAFPYNEVVVLDSTFGDTTNNAILASTTGASGTNYLAGWWMLNATTTATPATNVHNWSNNVVDAAGNALTDPNGDAFTNMPADATLQANYRDATWVLNTSIAGAVNGSWTPALAPLIVAEPTAKTVDAGSTVTFSVSAFAIPAATFQWRKNGVDIPGATGPSLTIANVTGTDADTYTVVVTNSAGSVTTDAVTLIVNGGPPVLALQPADTDGLLGATATLNTWAVGQGPFTYQWMKDGAPIAGANSLSLRLTGLQASDAGRYTVAVSNAAGTTTSSAATLTLVAPATTLPTVPQIPRRVFDVTAYGAVGDGVTDNTTAIQAAIDAANAAGGGTIEFPPARDAYLSGPITLYNFMDLQVDAGATLRALPYGRYPNSYTAPSHFINVIPNANDIEFSGGGTIDGDGGRWWAAYAITGPSTPRFRLIQSSTVTRMLFTGTTFSNSPTFHLAFRGPNVDVTIFGVTVYSPGTAPNTDGMDICGTNILVQRCAVSCGDDDIVAKPGGTFCRNIYIADCTIGTGHGISIGGQTNVGLDGMVVTNCTFDGTSTALRFKADATQGGPVQNVTFENLTMKNVLYPILFYSYYNQLGSPGAVSGSSQTTPTKVNAWNATPPNSLAATTIPIWKNIVVRNLTVINGSGYSTIWGLPTEDALIQNVRLENLNIQGGAGLELYDAANIQLVGTNNVGPILTCNALAITGQPSSRTINVGDSVTFTATAVGGSGTNNTGIAYRWNLDGNPLSDGIQPDGSEIGGANTATLTIANARVTKAGSYTLTASTTLDGYNTSASSLVANSLPVSATSEAATLTVNPIPATISLSNLTQTYDGAAKTPLVTTTPAGIAVLLTYAGESDAPIAAGAYAITATIADPNYTGPAITDTFTIQPAAATIVLSNLSHVYDGSAKPVMATTTPAGLAVQLTYDGAAAAPVGAGAYAVAATIKDPNYVGSGNGTLTIAKATPILSWSVPAAIPYGTPLGAAQLAAEASVPGTFAYTPASGTVLDVGPDQPLSAAFTPADAANYNGASIATTVAVNKATATVTLGQLSQTYTGAPHSVTVATDPANLAVDLTYAGSATVPTAAGSYAVVATVNDARYAGSASGTLVIGKANAVISLSPLAQSYDGTPKTVSATTVPADLPVHITYDGGSTVGPIYPGAHPVVATIDDANYQATTNETLTITVTALVRHAPTLDGILAGSLQLLSAENVTLNGNAAVAGDLLLPGTPTVQLNGGATYVALKDASGSASPTNYQLTLNGKALLRYVVRQVDAIALPTVAAPTPPGSARSVILGKSTDSAGDFATLRDLTIQGNAGRVAVPAGSYGSFTVNGSNTLVLGQEGATSPARYDFQSLTLNGTSTLEIVGPVVVTLATGTTINARVGPAAHPEWLELRIADGGLTLNGNASVHGRVIAPRGTIILNGSAVLIGSVVCDRLVLNGGAELGEPEGH